MRDEEKNNEGINPTSSAWWREEEEEEEEEEKIGETSEMELITAQLANSLI